MHKYLIFLCLLFFTNTIFSQTGNLNGTLTDKKKNRISYATVFLPTINKGTIADELGYYQLDNIPAGKYLIRIDLMGYKTFKDSVEIIAEKSVVRNFILEEDPYLLQSVEIIGRVSKSYKPDISMSATKTAHQIKDVPQSIQVVNKELMEDRQVFRVDEVMTNVSGVNSNLDGNKYMARGFEVSLENINGNRVGEGGHDAPLTQNLERVEVIKGPASALFGIASPGAVLNAVTKKPLKEKRYATNFTIGSWETMRLGMDGTGPINKDSTMLYRLNLGYETANSFRDYIKKRNYLISPSFSFVPNKSTQVNVELIYTKTDNTVARDQGIQLVQNNIYVLPASFNAAEPYDNLKNEQKVLTASLSHQFSDRLSFNVSTTHSIFSENYLATTSSHTFNSDFTKLARSISKGFREMHSEFITSYFSYTTKGTSKHELVLGLDYFNTEKLSYRKRAFGEIDGVPLLDFKDRKPVYVFNQNTVTYSFINGGIPVGFNYTGIYFQDMIEYKKFNVLLGLRYNTYNDLHSHDRADQKTDVVLPRLGIVYKITPHVNTFISYSQGYQPVQIPLAPPTDTTDTAKVRIFDPVESFQFEGGIKAELFKKRLTATISAYQIERRGRIVVDPTVDIFGGGVNFENLIQLKQEFIRGVEIDLSGKVNNNFKLSTNFAYTTIDVVDERTEKFQEDLESNNPKFAGGFWGKYDFTDTILNGFSFGAGVNYISDYILIDRQVFVGGKPFDFPGATTLDFSISYSVNKFDISLYAKNITDTRYFRGATSLVSIHPGEPRNFLVRVNFNF